VFQDLDATIKAVLQDASAPAEVRGADVTFETPEKSYAPAQATLNLFLHDVQENRVLRQEAAVLDRVANKYVSHRPPLRVDCTYLVTAWSVKTGGFKAAEEHGLLGLALLWLSGFLIIDEPYLQGSLGLPGRSGPLPAVVAQTREGQSMGEFWTALGIAPRPAFSLTVTIAMQPFTAPQEFVPVEGVQVRSTSLTDPALSGRVLDAALAPVAGVQVSVLEAGRQVSADPRGEFAFPELAFGAYTLSVQRPGRPDVQSPADYRADSQIHDVILPGP
jgi:hypothetical protein